MVGGQIQQVWETQSQGLVEKNNDTSEPWGKRWKVQLSKWGPLVVSGYKCIIGDEIFPSYVGIIMIKQPGCNGKYEFLFFRGSTLFFFWILPNCWGNKDSDGSFHIMLGFHQVGFELVQATEVTKTGRTCEIDLLNSVVPVLQHVSTPEVHSRKRLESSFARRIKAKILDTDLWGYVDIQWIF